MTAQQAVDRLNAWISPTLQLATLLASMAGAVWWLSASQTETRSELQQAKITIAGLDASVRRMSEELAGLNSYLPARTAAVDQRLDRLERHVEAMEARR